MSEDKERTYQFRGKTENDIESQYAKWQQKRAGRVFDIKRDPIVPFLPPPSPPPKFQHAQKIDPPDRLSMLVRFKVGKPPIRDRK
jgi:hypothetical protein